MASLRTGYIQRKCACGGESASGQCPECRKRATGRAHLLDSPSLARRAPASQGLAAEAAEPRPGHSFSDVRMYADAEISAIESSADESGETAPGQTGSAPCTSAEVDQTKKAAEAGRIAGRISVANAVRALGTVATPELQCAFASNFNTPATDPAFQTRRLIVQRFLTALAGRMGTAEPYICQPGNDPVCAQHGKTADVVAYVRVINRRSTSVRSSGPPIWMTRILLSFTNICIWWATLTTRVDTRSVAAWVPTAPL